MTTATLSKKLTPPELAKRYGIESVKVLAWIRSGELRAINIATRPDGRPRFLIDEEDVIAFENRRAANSQPKPEPPRHRQAGRPVRQFFQ
jgi:hypothetical protein